MAFEVPKTKYNGKIKETKLGKGDKAVTIGGETCYPFYLFEGQMPNLPKIAMEVYDSPPQEWAEAALKPFAGVTNDPVAWAKKCINDYGAGLICLQLASTDPNGLNRGADEAAAVVGRLRAMNCAVSLVNFCWTPKRTRSSYASHTPVGVPRKR